MADIGRTIWIDGKLVPWAEATVHVLSQSVQRGSLVFDFMSCHWLEDGPAVFGLREHVERFLGSMQLSGMRPALGQAEIERAIGEAVRANPGASHVKISAYYPTPALDVLPRDAHPSLAIAAFRPEESAPEWRRERMPAQLQVADARKMPGWVLSPQAKLAAGYLYTSVAKAAARADGFDDVLLLDEDGCIAESSTFSFFWIEAGEVFTAPVDVVLAGVTRRVVLELARAEALPVHEVQRPLAALARAQECFLTGTRARVWPVARVGARMFPAPVPGPLTSVLARRLDAVLEGKDPRLSPRWLQPLGGAC